jgi:hypothetical protein
VVGVALGLGAVLGSLMVPVTGAASRAPAPVMGVAGAAVGPAVRTIPPAQVRELDSDFARYGEAVDITKPALFVGTRRYAGRVMHLIFYTDVKGRICYGDNAELGSIGVKCESAAQQFKGIPVNDHVGSRPVNADTPHPYLDYIVASGIVKVAVRRLVIVSSNCAHDVVSLHRLTPTVQGYLAAASRAQARQRHLPVLVLAYDAHQHVIGRQRLNVGVLHVFDKANGKAELLPPLGDCAGLSLIHARS